MLKYATQKRLYISTDFGGGCSDFGRQPTVNQQATDTLWAGKGHSEGRQRAAIK